MKRQTLIFMVLALLWPLGGFAKERAPHDPYTKGQTYDYEVVTPKKGFIGGPASTAALPSFPPKQESDFDKRLVRVRVLDKRALKNGQRVVLQVDEIDANGHVAKARMHYAYVDTCSKGSCVFLTESDDSSETGDDAIRYASPLACARPPLLRGESDRGGYADSRSIGVAYAIRKADPLSSAIEVEAVQFENSQAILNKDYRTTLWYGSEIVDFAKADGANILFREKQQWDKPDDWLWKKMERFDRNGFVMMRCTRMKQASGLRSQ